MDILSLLCSSPYQKSGCYRELAVSRGATALKVEYQNEVFNNNIIKHEWRTEGERRAQTKKRFDTCRDGGVWLLSRKTE